MMTASAVWQRM